MIRTRVNAVATPALQPTPAPAGFETLPGLFLMKTLFDVLIYTLNIPKEVVSLLRWEACNNKNLLECETNDNIIKTFIKINQS
jgi:hypothetical protein